MGDVRGWLRPTLAILAAAALLGLAGAAGPLFVSSAGTAMLDTELEAAGDGPTTLLGVQASGPLGADDIREADRRLQVALDERELPAAGLQLVITVADDDGQQINLVGRDGRAMEQLPPVVDDGAGAVAVDAFNAPRLDIGAGDELQVTAGGSDPVAIRVGPLVEAFDRNDMHPAWQPVAGLLTAVDDPRIPPPPPALVMDTSEALSILDQLGHEVGDDGVVTGAGAQVGWHVELAERPTIEQARALVPHLDAVRSAAADPTTELGSALAAPGWSPPVTAGAQLDSALHRVGGAVSELEVPVRLLTVAGQVLALGGLAAAVVLGGRRRMSRARLWSVRGVTPIQLATRWTALAVLPVAFGVGGGWWAAWLLMGRLGPGAADASVHAGVLTELAVAALAALVVIAVVSGLAVRLGARDASIPQRVPPVAEAVAVVLAAVALWQADARGGVVTLGADGTLRLDPLAVALPVLLVVAICAAGARLLGPMLRVLARTQGRHPSWFLASRRLRTFGGATMALTFLTAASVGLFVLAATLHSSSETTVDEKAGLSLGADAALRLSRATVTEPPDPSELPMRATRVRRAPEATLDDGTMVEVLAIDPGSFADVAYQPRHLGGDVDVRELVSALTDAPADAPRPAIVVGGRDLDVGVVRIADVEVALERVGAATVFPGTDPGLPTFVIPDGGPLAPDDPAVTVQLSIAVFPELWVDRGDLDLAAFRFELAQVEQPDVGTGPGATSMSVFELADDLRADPGVAPTTWAFTYLRAQAVVVAALALLALLGHHVARQRQQALGTNLAVRMGLRRSTRAVAELIEVVAMAAVALALGVGSGLLAARTVATNFDPVPDVPLPMVFELPIAVLSQPLVVASIAVAATVVVTMRAVDRMDVARLLRSDG